MPLTSPICATPSPDLGEVLVTVRNSGLSGVVAPLPTYLAKRGTLGVDKASTDDDLAMIIASKKHEKLDA